MNCNGGGFLYSGLLEPIAFWVGLGIGGSALLCCVVLCCVVLCCTVFECHW
jgi:hypothetical protein